MSKKIGGINLEEQFMNKILKYLAGSNKSIEQVKKKLAEYDCPKQIAEKIIASLIEYNYVDDEVFAKNFVYDSLTLKHYGKIKIKFDLEQKKISSDIISSVLADISKDDEIESALIFAKRKPFDENKLKNMLYRRGFSFGIISEVINKIKECD